MGCDSTRLSIQVKTILALETSCDETAVAILRGHKLLASEIASQIAENEKCGRVRSHKRTRPRKLVDDRRLDCQRSRDWSQETLPCDQSPRRAFAFAIFRRPRREPERFTYCERWTHDVASSGWPGRLPIDRAHGR